jgi:ABC-type multidrug transport system ATPase subunit
VQPTGGQVRVGGHDTATDYRAARSLIGLVPQEVNLEPFEKVINTVRFSRGLFGKPRDEALIERVLRQLSLWDKRDSQIRALSGGMKRRVLIAKALAHEPRVLFLDEPTAGVDVELRRDMWEVVRGLQEDGVTIILTTHYLEEAEAMADRVGVITKGRLLLVEEKAALMTRLGRKELVIELREPLDAVPEALAQHESESFSTGTGCLHLRHEGRADRDHPASGGYPGGGAAPERRGDAELVAGGDLRRSRGRRCGGQAMNLRAIAAIYRFEMGRTFRTLGQSVVSPVLTTSLYFVVFGAAIGSRIEEVEGVSYGAFIVPGLIMLTVLQQAISNASFGIYFPKFVGTIYELLSAPVSFLEVTAGYVLAAATKALMIGLIILGTSFFFVDLVIAHPLWMVPSSS